MQSELEPGTIGITSTIPIEIPMAAGASAVDMNNLFISSTNPKELVSQAERAGLSFNLCGWVKGLFILGNNDIFDKIIVVDSGDCADLVALADFWNERGIEIIYFNYPADRKWKSMKAALDQFMDYFEVTDEDVRITKTKLDRIREKLHELDRLTWHEGKVSGLENHLYLVQSSDFGGDTELYEHALDNFIEEAYSRSKNSVYPGDSSPRLGFVGVPPIITNFHHVVEDIGGSIVYNEIQHQFSMPEKQKDIVEQYLNYTYPYGGAARLEYIEAEIARRNIDGIILYSENFCYKSIINTFLKSRLPVPAIEIEGKSPEPMDARTKLRLEAFIDMLSDKNGL